MKLVIISRACFAYDGQRYLTHRLEGRYIDGLARYFDSVILCAPIVRKGIDADYTVYSGYRYQLKSLNVRICELAAPARQQLNVLKVVRDYFRVTRTLIPQIRSADLVYIAMPNPRGVIAFLICEVLHRPFLVYLGGDWAQTVLHNSRWRNHPWRRVIMPVYVRAARLLEKIVVRSAPLRLVHGARLQQKYDDGSGRTFGIGSFLDISPDDILSREDTCQGSRITILYVGSLDPVKGVRYLIEAIPRVLEQIPGYDISLEIVGAGVQEPYRQQARKLGIEDRIVFRGYIGERNQLVRAYADADIFVLPSLSEGFPKVVYEAMSQGLPVVATKVGGIPEILQHRRTALLVRPASPGELAKAICEVATNPTLRRTLIASGRKLFRQVASEDPVTQTIEEITRCFPQLAERLNDYEAREDVL